TQEFLTRVSLPIHNGANGVLDDLTRKGAALKVAIIDACRENPFHPPEGQRGYALSRGLRPVSVAGSFVIYSAGDNQSALDRLSEADKDPNSVFTRTLVPALRADLPLIDAIKASQENTHALAASVDHEQTPAYYDEVLGRACLSRECMTAAPAASDAALSALIDGAASADFIATLTAGLPDGPLKERAKARMAELKKTRLANLSVAPVNPPSPPTSNQAGRVDEREPHFPAIWVKPGGSDFVARHGLSAQEYQEQFDQLVGRRGYCLTDVSGYEVAGQARYAAIWEKKDCTAFVAHVGLTPQQYQQEFDQLIGDGFRLKLVDGYTVGGEDRYATIWDKSPGPAFVARHGMTAGDLEQQLDQLVGQQGYCLTDVSGYEAGGQERYAALWEKNDCPPFIARSGLTAQGYQQQFDRWVGQGFRLKLVVGYKVRGEDRYAAIWEKASAPAFVARHGMTPQEYQRQFDQLVGTQGYRLTWVSVY
ncbi:MAG TPA: hypothetical protein VGJ26_03090, partial [Pirellulales bacterium]